MNNLCPEAVHPRGPAEWGPIIIIIIIMHLITIASDGVTKTRSYYYLSYYFYQKNAPNKSDARARARCLT